MPNTNLPTNITPGVTATFEADVEAAWTEINLQSRYSGVRDVTSQLIAGRVTSGRLLLERRDDRVRYIFDAIVLPPEAEGLSWQILSGTVAPLFAPPYTVTEMYRINTAGDSVRLAVTNAGGVLVQFAKSGLPITTVLQSFSNAAWPNPLPGVPA